MTDSKPTPHVANRGEPNIANRGEPHVASRGEPDNVASRSEMSWVVRQIQSRIMRLLMSPTRRAGLRRARELWRRVRDAPHRVHYFHQVDDPYSHLAAQALPALLAGYEIDLELHVTSADTGLNLPEPKLLAELARRDCAAVAPHYGLAFPAAASAPTEAAVRDASRLLVAARKLGGDVFAARAMEVGRELHGGDTDVLRASCETGAVAGEAEAAASLEQGRSLRAKLGHYSGGMFFYAGEWYWGVDRLYHLERRLTQLGAVRGEARIRFGRPEIPMDSVPRASEMTLEVFPSLRSPYTAISFERVLELAERTGVPLEVRPVLPMVMRGVPVTFSKGVYIMTDTFREAEKMGAPFGTMLDPIGEPVRRAYSLWPTAQSKGRGGAFLAAFLRAAFAEGIDTSTDTGLRRIVEAAGLAWEDVSPHLGDSTWEEELEGNRLAMVNEMGQWGVPSFRLRGPAGEPELTCWGQDRLWLIGREIQRRGARGGV